MLLANPLPKGFFLTLPKDMFIDFRETGSGGDVEGGGEGGRERERERERELSIIHI